VRKFCSGVSDPRRRPRYPSDLTDGQWEHVRPLVDRAGPERSGCNSDLRAVLDAVNYRWSTGCSWRMLPHDMPPWRTVYGHFRRWRRGGLLWQIRGRLLSRGRDTCRNPH
jgi:transposase